MLFSHVLSSSVEIRKAVSFVSQYFYFSKKYIIIFEYIYFQKLNRLFESNISISFFQHTDIYLRFLSSIPVGFNLKPFDHTYQVLTKHMFQVILKCKQFHISRQDFNIQIIWTMVSEIKSLPSTLFL